MKTILVALDASERASHVLAEAVKLAGWSGARLAFVRAVSLPVELPPGALAMPPIELGPALVESARQSLQRFAAQVPESVGGPASVAIHVEIGTPWTVVCDEAKRLDADLVVIGAHGYSALARLLGTTAAGVVNHIDRPVLVVRERGAGAR